MKDTYSHQSSHFKDQYDSFHIFKLQIGKNDVIIVSHRIRPSVCYPSTGYRYWRQSLVCSERWGTCLTMGVLFVLIVCCSKHNPIANGSCHLFTLYGNNHYIRKTNLAHCTCMNFWMKYANCFSLKFMQVKMQCDIYIDLVSNKMTRGK